jgi:hypothetical protein
MSSAVTTSTTESALHFDALNLRRGRRGCRGGCGRCRGSGRLRENLRRRQRTKKSQGCGGGDRLGLKVHLVLSVKSNELI